nr:MAG TPA: hypothetical protein [Caudoviricetes sp.]
MAPCEIPSVLPSRTWLKPRRAASARTFAATTSRVVIERVGEGLITALIAPC